MDLHQQQKVNGWASSIYTTHKHVSSTKVHAQGCAVCIATETLLGFEMFTQNPHSTHQHVCILLHTHTHALYTHTHTHTHIHTLTHTHTHTHTNIHIHTHIHTQTYTYTHTQYTDFQLHTCNAHNTLCIHVHIHSHTHTNTHLLCGYIKVGLVWQSHFESLAILLYEIEVHSTHKLFVFVQHICLICEHGVYG